VREHSKSRIALITGRYAARQREKHQDDRRVFDGSFRAIRDAVIRPVFEEIAAELRAAGPDPRITCDGALEAPSVELVLGIQGVQAPPGSDIVGFSVISRREVPEVLAYLVVRAPPMDLIRFAYPTDIAAYQVEQIVLDAIEHVFACRSI
jgi:hypothetical protein